MSGMFFDVLVPNLSAEAPFAITGADCQVLTIKVKSGSTVQSEAGAMMYMSPGMKTSAECGSCSRVCAGETCCKVIYTNEAKSDGYVGLTAPYPAKIIPVNLGSYGEAKLISKSGVYMSSVGEASVTVNCDCGVTGCCIRGMGCMRAQTVGNGTAFLAAGGTILTKELGAGEKIVVDADSIVGYKDTVELGWQFNGGPTAWCCAGEGCCNLTMTGPGTVYIQSMSLPKYIHALAPPRQNAGDAADVAGAVAGAL